MDIWAQGESTTSSSYFATIDINLRAAGVLFFVLFFRFIADLPKHPEMNGALKGKEFVDILIVAVTVIVVAIPGKLILQRRIMLILLTTVIFRGSSTGGYLGLGLCYYTNGQGEQPCSRASCM